MSLKDNQRRLSVICAALESTMKRCKYSLRIAGHSVEFVHRLRSTVIVNDEKILLFISNSIILYFNVIYQLPIVD
jgi:hypothetical protein